MNVVKFDAWVKSKEVPPEVAKAIMDALVALGEVNGGKILDQLSSQNASPIMAGRYIRIAGGDNKAITDAIVAASNKPTPVVLPGSVGPIKPTLPGQEPEFQQMNIPSRPTYHPISPQDPAIKEEANDAIPPRPRPVATPSRFSAPKINRGGSKFSLDFLKKIDRKTMMIGAGVIVGVLIIIGVLAYFIAGPSFGFGKKNSTVEIPTSVAGQQQNFDPQPNDPAAAVPVVPVESTKVVAVPTTVPPAGAAYLFACNNDLTGKSVAAYNRTPNKDIIGDGGLGPRLYKGVDFSASADRAGSEISMKVYRVVPVTLLPNVVTVQTQEGVFFAPSSWFPAIKGQNPDCLSGNDASEFIKAMDTLAPPPTRLVFNGQEWWAPIFIGILFLMFVGVLFAIVQGKRFVELGILMLIFVTMWLLIPGIKPGYELYLFIFGSLASLALGSLGGLAPLKAIMGRNKSSVLPKELSDLLSSLNRGFGLVGSIDWSGICWFFGLNLSLMLLNPALSPLNIVFGTKDATLILVGGILLFSTLEAYRRGGRGDWGSFVMSCLAFVNIAILKFTPDHGAWMYLYILVWTVIVILSLVGLGYSNRQEVSADRLPDAIFQYAAIAMASLIIAVFILV
jgi:hypothetical protein